MRATTIISATLAMLCLAGCGWTRQKVDEILADAGGRQGDPGKAASSFAKLGDFVADKDPGPPPVRAAAMEAMTTIAIDRDYRTSDPAAYARLVGLLESEFGQPHLPEDEVKAGGTSAADDAAGLKARALWNLGRLGSRKHIPAAIAALADDTQAYEVFRSAIDVLARQSEAVAADPENRPAAILALAHRVGVHPDFQPASVRHLEGALLDLATLVPLLPRTEGAGRVVALRWTRQLLTAAAATRSVVAPELAAAAREALLSAATAERPVADQARAALMRWSPVAWAGFCLGGHQGRGGAFAPAETSADLAVLLPDLAILARAAARPGGGDGWTLLRDGVVVLDERAQLAPEAWTVLRGRMVGRILEQAAVSQPAQADQLCSAVLHVDAQALAAWFSADPAARPPAFAERYLAALVDDPAVQGDATLRAATAQALASLMAVPDPELRRSIGAVLATRHPVGLAKGTLAILAKAEAEPVPACTALVEVAVAAAGAITGPDKPDLRPLGIALRRNLGPVLPQVRAYLAKADPGLLADLTLAERFARGAGDAVDAQVLADLLHAKALDDARTAAVETCLRGLIDGPDEDAALVAAAILTPRARAAKTALPNSHWPSVQRLAALAAPTPAKP